MADIIPIALRYGITEERTWCMTHGELIAEIEARRQGERERNQFLDLLNGKFCSVYASFHGTESCPADYMVNSTEDKTIPKTQDELVQQAWGIPSAGSNS